MLLGQGPDVPRCDGLPGGEVGRAGAVGEAPAGEGLDDGHETVGLVPIVPGVPLLPDLRQGLTQQGAEAPGDDALELPLVQESLPAPEEHVAGAHQVRDRLERRLVKVP